jgi:hypothetical protein
LLCQSYLYHCLHVHHQLAFCNTGGNTSFSASPKWSFIWLGVLWVPQFQPCSMGASSCQSSGKHNSSGGYCSSYF